MITIGDNPCLPEIIGNYLNCKHDSYGVFIEDKYVSIPFFSYGNSNGKEELLKKKRWEFRGFNPVSNFFENKKVSSFLKIEISSDIQLNKFNSNIRRKIRKAYKNGILLKYGKTELLNDFYKVYNLNMLRLGSPAMDKNFFINLISNYTNGFVEVFVAYLNNEPIGSALLLSYKGFFENCWFATLKKYNHLYTSYLLHWEMIKYSISRKGSIYSFGRSTKNSKVHLYKKQWNTYDIDLYWSYSHRKKINIRSLLFLHKIWRILPKYIINSLGPFIAKRIY